MVLAVVEDVTLELNLTSTFFFGYYGHICFSKRNKAYHDKLSLQLISKLTPFTPFFPLNYCFTQLLFGKPQSAYPLNYYKN